MSRPRVRVAPLGPCEAALLFEPFYQKAELLFSVSIASPINDFRLYYMISKIYHYAKVNKVSAKLLLIVPKYSQEFLDNHLSEVASLRNQAQNIIRLKEIYAPAIKNDLMEIVEIELSNDECCSLLQEVT